MGVEEAAQEVDDLPEVQRPSSRKSTATPDSKDIAHQRSESRKSTGRSQNSHHSDTVQGDVISPTSAAAPGGVWQSEGKPVGVEPLGSLDIQHRTTSQSVIHSPTVTSTTRRVTTVSTTRAGMSQAKQPAANSLDAFLNAALGQGDEEEEAEKGSQHKEARRGSILGLELINPSRLVARASMPPREELGAEVRPRWYQSLFIFSEQTFNCSRAIDHRAFNIFFMFLTFWALFSSDFDLVFGDLDSKFWLSVVNTGVFLLFFMELIMQSCSKSNYMFKAYFWLDIVALVSLLPDTYFVQELMNGDGSAFAAGRSSKVARMVRVAARSTKATRLNRLTRIVRVAALMPRIAAMFGKGQKNEEATKIFSRKINQIFAFLDDDMDGWVTQEAADNCLAKLKADKATDKSRRALSLQVPQSLRMTTRPTIATSSVASCPHEHSDKHSDRQSEPESLHGMVRQNSDTTVATGGEESRGDRGDEVIDLDLFRLMVEGDERIRTRMMKLCHQQVKKSNNMQNIAARHSEDIGIKVALGVLIMLLIFGMLEPISDDCSAELGLEFMDQQVQTLEPGIWANTTTWPLGVQRHVQLWAEGLLRGSDGAKSVVYLDLRQHQFCNALADGGQGNVRSCTELLDSGAAAEFTWLPRGSLVELDKSIFNSRFRSADLAFYRLFSNPAYYDTWEDLDEATLEAATTSTAVLDNRPAVEAGAWMSVLTTSCVIIIILLGITLLTQDLNFLSLSLLKPLRTLAEEMQSIVQLQVNGLNMDNDVNTEKSCAEIRMINTIFTKMKKAIKSWGKYVPWPVVQILLSNGMDAKPGMRQKEVTIFFSDIAGFTTIVEHMEPEQTLLLLSRYFNDMSRVIDNHQGIVIEFIGDAILSVFGAPMKNPDHPTAGVKASLKMLEALDRINRWALARDLPKIDVRCGVHTGPVLVGNMGFQARMKYGIVGEEANIPDRLEELNKTYGTNFLISQDTYKRINHDAFVIRPIDILKFRHMGRRDLSVERIYNVMAKERLGQKKHKLRPAADAHKLAFKKYTLRQFSEAMAMFGDVSKMVVEATGVEEDLASLLMMKRCETYLQNPPSHDWDGTWEEK